MKIISTTLSVLLITITMNGQNTFQKVSGGTGIDVGFSVCQTTDGGFIIAGTSTISFQELYLIKTNFWGDTLWIKTYCGNYSGVTDAEVQQTSDSGYIVTATNDMIDFSFLKTNQYGDTLWTKRIHANGWSNSIQQTIDGGYVGVGNTFMGAGQQDIYFFKTNSLGDTLWTKVIGESNFENASCVKQTSDSGFIIAGNTNSFGAGGRDVCLIKTNANGAITWTKTYGSSAMDENAKSISQTIDGGYILVGSTGIDGTGTSDIYLIKTDSNGDTLWTKTFGNSLFDEGQDVKQAFDGGYIITGGADGFSSILLKTNSFGDTLWTKAYGGSISTWALSVSQTNDSGYIFTGLTTAFGNTDLYFVKTDSYGNSNCNESSTDLLVKSTTTVINVPSFIVSNGGVYEMDSINIVNGGIVTTLCSNTSINEHESLERTEIFPNPTSGEFTITLLEFGKKKLEIYDVLGKQIFSSTFSERRETINHKFNSGIYFARISSGEINVVRKLVVE